MLTSRNKKLSGFVKFNVANINNTNKTSRLICLKTIERITMKSSTQRTRSLRKTKENQSGFIGFHSDLLLVCVHLFSFSMINFLWSTTPVMRVMKGGGGEIKCETVGRVGLGCWGVRILSYNPISKPRTFKHYSIILMFFYSSSEAGCQPVF